MNREENFLLSLNQKFEKIFCETWNTSTPLGMQLYHLSYKTFLTESIYANLATDISWTIYKFLQIISVDYVDN